MKDGNSYCFYKGKASVKLMPGTRQRKLLSDSRTARDKSQSSCSHMQLPTNFPGWIFGMRCAYAHTLTFGLYSLLQRDHVIYGKAKYSSLHANGEDATYASSCVLHISLKTHRFKIQNSKSLHLHMFN